MNTVKTIVMGNKPLFREGMACLLNNSSFKVIAQPENIQKAQILALQMQPDLMVVDLSDVAKENDQYLSQLRQIWPNAKVLALSNELCTRRLSAALSADVNGYTTHDISAAQLKKSLEDIMKGEKVFPMDVVKLLMAGDSLASQGGLSGAGRKRLSPREQEILQCLVKGSSNKVIALELNITEATVKVHLKSLLRKINVTNRTQAAIWALNNGLSARNESSVKAGSSSMNTQQREVAAHA